MRRFSKSLIALFITLALALSGLTISPASTTELMQVLTSDIALSSGIVEPAKFLRGDQDPNPSDSLDSISCPAADGCVAAGYFANSAGFREAFTQTQTNGTFTEPISALFDPGFLAEPDPNLDLFPEEALHSISCSSAGNCVAVGDVINRAGYREAFTQTQTNGNWATSEPVIFETGIQFIQPESTFNSVSCSSDGNCVAAGKFRNIANDELSFTQTQINGEWANARPATFDVGVQWRRAYSDFNSVSCSSDGNCVAVGIFRNVAGDDVAFTQSQTEGNWSNARPATFDVGTQSLDPHSDFSSVSCSQAGNCVAVGHFENAAHFDVAFTQDLTDGEWANARPATFGEGVQGSTPLADFRSVSCSSIGNCVAAGSFTNAAGYDEAFTQSQTDGEWAQSMPAIFDLSVQSDNPTDVFESVSCSSDGNCVAAGSFKNAAGFPEAFSQTQINGAWAKSEPATFGPSDQHEEQSSYFESVSCSPAGTCVAAGYFAYNPWDRRQEAFTQNITDAIVPLPVTPEAPVVIPATPAATIAANLAISTKSVRFDTSSNILTRSQKATLKRLVKKLGKSSTFAITASAGKLPGVTDKDVKALAKKRGQVVKAYLVKLGISKSQIKIRIKIINQGIVPKTKILALYVKGS